MEAGLPITFEEQYLTDVVEKRDALIKSIADSISATEPGGISPRQNITPDQTRVAREEIVRVQTKVRETVDWLANRMSVGFSW